MALIIISRCDFTISGLDLCVAGCEIVVSFPKICLIMDRKRIGMAAKFGMGGKRMTQKAVARMGATTNTWQVMGIVGVVIGMLVASVRMVGVGNRMVGMGMVMVGMGVLVGMVQPCGNSEGVAISQPRVEACSASTLGIYNKRCSNAVSVALSRRRYPQQDNGQEWVGGNHKIEHNAYG